MSNSIQRRFENIASSIKNIGLAKESLDEIVSWGEIYGRFLYTNHAGIYRDDDFEKLVFEKLHHLDKSVVSPSKDALHVISEAYGSGGHTRLLEKLITGGAEGDIVITRNCSSGALREKNVESLYEKDGGFSIEELFHIFLSYKTIYLHLHPDDLKAFVAAGLVRRNGVKVVMINHADHVFSFGFSCVDEVAEVSLYGLKLTNTKRAVDSSFIGIPILNCDFKPLTHQFSPKELNILSGATSLKYKPTEDESFPRFVSKLLKSNPNLSVTVIGPNLKKDWWWWKVKITNISRLKIHKKLPYDEYLKALDDADIYVDSFPMTGGTGFPEVRNMGKVVSGLLCGSSGYTPLDSVKSKTEQDLINGIVDCFKFGVKSKLFQANDDVRLLQRCIDVHNPVNVSRRLIDLAQTSAKCTGSEQPSSIDVEFYSKAWRKQRDINFGKQLYTFFLKNWRKQGDVVLKEYLNGAPFTSNIKMTLARIRIGLLK